MRGHQARAADSGSGELAPVADDQPGWAVPAAADTKPADAPAPYTGPKSKQGKTPTSARSSSVDPATGKVTFGKTEYEDTDRDGGDPNSPDKREAKSSSMSASRDGSLSVSSEHAVTEGGKTKTRGRGVNVGSDGVSINSTRKETEGAGENAKTTGTTSSYGFGKDGASYKRGAAGDGAGFGVKAGPDGASGNITYKHGVGTLDVGGGIALTITGPAETAEGYVVEVKRTSSINVGGGAAKPDTAGASGALALSGSSSIRRVFSHDEAGKKQATEFATNETKLTALFATDIKTAKEAKKQMAIGETRVEGTDGSLGAKGNVSAAGVEVSAGASTAGSEGCSIYRRDANTFEVTRHLTSTDTAVAGAAAAGTGVSASKSRTKGHSETWVFDTRDKEQARELTSYLESGTRPREAKLKVASDSRSSTSTTGVELPVLMSSSSNSTVSETDSVDEHGKRWKEIIGERALSWTSKITDDKHNSSEQFRAVIDQQTGQAAYGMTVKAGGSDGSATQEELGKATGTGTIGREGVEASGDWTVTAYFTADEIEHIVESVLRNPSAAGALPSLADDAAVLRSTLARDQADTTKCARAIAKYVSRTGPKGLAALRSIAGITAASGRDEIALQPKDGGKSPFLGPDGRALYQTKITTYQQRIEKGENGAAIASEINTDLVDLDLRYSELRHDKFPDLPGKLLVEERDKVNALTTILMRLRDSALAKLTKDASARSAQLGGEVASKMAAYAEASARWSTQQVRAHDAFTACRVRYYKHIETSLVGDRSMRDAERGEYSSIDALYKTAIGMVETFDVSTRLLESAEAALTAKIVAGASAAAVADDAAKLATRTSDVAAGYSGTADLFVKVGELLDKLWSKYARDYSSHIEDKHVPKGI